MHKTDKIIVRKTELENLEKILGFEKDNSIFVLKYSKEEHKEIINKEYHLSIFEKKSESLIGFIILVGKSNLNKTIEFRRIVISKKGLGYGKEALKLIKHICFNELGAKEIWLDVFQDNVRAIKLYESQGFSLKKLKKFDDKRNLLVMSISK